MQNSATIYHEGVAKARRSNVTSFSDIVAPCAAATIDKQNLIKHPVPPLTFAKALGHPKTRLVALDSNLKTVIFHSHSQARETDDSPLTDLFAISDSIDTLSIASTDASELSKFLIAAQKGVRTQSPFTSYDVSLETVVKKGGGAVTYEDMKVPTDERDAAILFSLLPKVLPLAPGQYFPEGIHITDPLPADTGSKRIDSIGRAWFEAVAYTHSVNGAPLTCTTNGKLIATTTFTNDGNVRGGELSQDDKQELIDNGNMYQTFYGALDTSQLTDTFQVELTFLSPTSTRVQTATPAIREALYAKLAPWLLERDAAERAAANLCPTPTEPSGPVLAPGGPITGSTGTADNACSASWRMFGCGLAADGQSIVPAALNPEFVEAISGKRGHLILARTIDRLRLTLSSSATVPPQIRGDHMTRPFYIAMAHFRLVSQPLRMEANLDNKINVFNFVPANPGNQEWIRYRDAHSANDADDLYEPDAKKHAKKARGIFRDGPCESWITLLTTLQNLLLVMFTLPFTDPTTSLAYQLITELYDTIKQPDHRDWFEETQVDKPWIYHSILANLQGRLNLWLRTITTTADIAGTVAAGVPIANTAAVESMQINFNRFLQRLRDAPAEGGQLDFGLPDASLSLFSYGPRLSGTDRPSPQGLHHPVPRDPKRIADKPGKPDPHKRARLDDLPPKELAARKRRGLLVYSGRGALPRFTATLAKSNGRPPCYNSLYVDKACRHSRASDCGWYHVPQWDHLSTADKDKLTAFVEAQPHVSFSKNRGSATGE